METVRRAMNGDDEAFYSLIQENKSTLYRTAFAYTKNEHDAIDIVQEAVYKAYISLGKLKEPDYFHTWLTRILINCAIDFLRKKKRVIPFDEPLPESVTSNGVLEQKPVEDTMDLLQAVANLNEKYKTVIILKYYRDLPLKQIAEILDCPIGTVKSRLNMALKKLRINLEEDWVYE
ncbi:sigma-70 family RNA polymerase sigma factor [Radiobacillus deserti]|uniref:Sigma-70 family RNA polymerase sigma factor n=1 Tax=Radiobacillus deserti TaxID=2594883 RepID=A0A516KDP7_9BACI|nr:sigma-70 family RNA polymerase sigma factor [Radiobacillus deserti]QDP39500.1 sigma-70 family RNA polymerase sigma factor [Radiobacillus deserti]